MNRLILIFPDQGSGFKPILWSKNIAGNALTYPSTARGWKKIIQEYAITQNQSIAPDPKPLPL
jgi:hypothetical protein